MICAASAVYQNIFFWQQCLYCVDVCSLLCPRFYYSIYIYVFVIMLKCLCIVYIHNTIDGKNVSVIACAKVKELNGL